MEQLATSAQKKELFESIGALLEHRGIIPTPADPVSATPVVAAMRFAVPRGLDITPEPQVYMDEHVPLRHNQQRLLAFGRMYRGQFVVAKGYFFLPNTALVSMENPPHYTSLMDSLQPLTGKEADAVQTMVQRAES